VVCLLQQPVCCHTQVFQTAPVPGSGYLSHCSNLKESAYTHLPIMLLLACPWSLDTAVSISSPSVHPSQHAHARHGRDLHLHVQRRDNRDARESSVGWSLPPRRRGHIHAGGRILGTADSEESRHLLFSFYGISSRSKPFLSDSLHSFRFVWATAKEQIWAAVTVSPCLSKPPGLSATLLGPCLVSYFSKKR